MIDFSIISRSAFGIGVAPTHKHIHGLSFDLGHRTFRLATATTRESWLIVIHPTGRTTAELSSSRRKRRQKVEEASNKCPRVRVRTLTRGLHQTDVPPQRPPRRRGQGLVGPGRAADVEHHVQQVDHIPRSVYGKLERVRPRPKLRFLLVGEQSAFHAYDYGPQH